MAIHRPVRLISRVDQFVPILKTAELDEPVGGFLLIKIRFYSAVFPFEFPTICSSEKSLCTIIVWFSLS